jgi:predicted membrane-bound mannosyltransferase
VLSGLASSGGVASILGALDPTAQYIVLAFLGVALIGLGWVVRERIAKWAAGDR